MTSIPTRTVVRMLRIALGYGSRTEKITRLLNSTQPDVALYARSLEASGYIRAIAGTVELDPQ